MLHALKSLFPPLALSVLIVMWILPLLVLGCFLPLLIIKWERPLLHTVRLLPLLVCIYELPLIFFECIFPLLVFICLLPIIVLLCMGRSPSFQGRRGNASRQSNRFPLRRACRFPAEARGYGDSLLEIVAYISPSPTTLR